MNDIQLLDRLIVLYNTDKDADMYAIEEQPPEAYSGSFRLVGGYYVISRKNTGIIISSIYRDQLKRGVARKLGNTITIKNSYGEQAAVSDSKKKLKEK